ncbi:hypothetical protein P6P90_03220 [Ectobacillus antri]|uniref:Conjugal transfer protein n=1 Tax=Ectobacillus antri TaxID=2486280 RepID=A0ABT6H211_9BACI|nr:hypothetical protein [Ectobacillus antri]MDG4656335.1 hypothetical protein [Ectobacillus antri]MDG5753010.1 hypothetical protein [Ectobacillus antri]
MEEKQEYTIPGNVNGQFEVLPHVTLRDLLCFVPSLLLDIPIFLMPISMYIKIPIITITLMVSAVLVYVRPVRENIPFWHHARECLRFFNRQRVYYYRKESVYVETVETTRKGRERPKSHSGSGA